jgi:hypothetical protein
MTFIPLAFYKIIYLPLISNVKFKNIYYIYIKSQLGHLVTLCFNFFLIKIKFKGNFVFQRVLTAKLDRVSKLIELKVQMVQIVKF